jgi:hypothetical protein
MCIEVTRYTVLKERRMVSPNVSEGIEPRNLFVALGQEFLYSEANITARINGECVGDVPGSKSIAGHSTVHDGTWESHAVLKRSFQQAEKARRRYGGMAVGPTHLRGIAEVMFGGACSSLEGVGSMLQRGKVT